MKIIEVTDKHILFDNGNKITYDHEQDCCEYNYADFSVINRNNVNYNFDFDENLTFKFIEGAGFMFGSKDKNDNMRWIFVPCYSEQNGYYTSHIDIYYETRILVTSGNCEEQNYL